MQTKLEKRAVELWKNYRRKDSIFWHHYEDLLNQAQKKVQARTSPQSPGNQKESLKSLNRNDRSSSNQKFVFYNKVDGEDNDFEISPLTIIFSIVFGGFTTILIHGDLKVYVLFYLILWGVLLSIVQSRYFDTPMPKAAERVMIEITPNYFVFRSKNILRQGVYENITKIRVQKIEIVIQSRVNQVFRVPLYNAQLERIPAQAYRPLIQQLGVLIEHHKQIKP